MEKQQVIKIGGRKLWAKQFLLNNFSFVGLIFVVVLFEILTEGLLLGERNLMNVFNNFFTIGLTAMAFTFVMSIGELDFSVLSGIRSSINVFRDRRPELYRCCQ